MIKTKTVFSILIAACLVLGTTLRLINLTVKSRSPDENVYTSYAAQAVEKGAGSTKELVKNYNAVETRWQYPTPIRVGYIYLGAAVMKMAGSSDVQVLAYVSAGAAIISLLLLVLMGLRFFNPLITLIALLFMSVSPMELAISRRAWPDGVVGAAALGLIYCGCEVLCSRRRRVFSFLFWLAGTYGLLLKETGIVIYGLCIIWLVTVMIFKERNFKQAVFFSLGSFLSIIAGIFILSWFAGGFLPFIETAKHNICALAVNEYALQYHTGPAYILLQSFFAAAPLATVLSLIGTGMILLPQKLFKFTLLGGESKQSRHIFLGIIFFMSAFTLITLIKPYLKNLRYLSVIFAPFYLMSGVGVGYIVAGMKHKGKRNYFYITSAIIVLVVSLGAAGDYYNYRRIFIEKEAPDLAGRCLRDYSIYAGP